MSESGPGFVPNDAGGEVSTFAPGDSLESPPVHTVVSVLTATGRVALRYERAKIQEVQGNLEKIAEKAESAPLWFRRVTRADVTELQASVAALPQSPAAAKLSTLASGWYDRTTGVAGRPKPITLDRRDIGEGFRLTGKLLAANERNLDMARLASFAEKSARVNSALQGGNLDHIAEEVTAAAADVMLPGTGLALHLMRFGVECLRP